MNSGFLIVVICTLNLALFPKLTIGDGDNHHLANRVSLTFSSDGPGIVGTPINFYVALVIGWFSAEDRHQVEWETFSNASEHLKYHKSYLDSFNDYRSKWSIIPTEPGILTVKAKVSGPYNALDNTEYFSVKVFEDFTGEIKVVQPDVPKLDSSYASIPNETFVSVKLNDPSGYLKLAENITYEWKINGDRLRTSYSNFSINFLTQINYEFEVNLTAVFNSSSGLVTRKRTYKKLITAKDDRFLWNQEKLIVTSNAPASTNENVTFYAQFHNPYYEKYLIFWEERFPNTRRMNATLSAFNNFTSNWTLTYNNTGKEYINAKVYGFNSNSKEWNKLFANNWLEFQIFGNFGASIVLSQPKFPGELVSTMNDTFVSVNISDPFNYMKNALNVTFEWIIDSKLIETTTESQSKFQFNTDGIHNLKVNICINFNTTSGQFLRTKTIGTQIVAKTPIHNFSLNDTQPIEDGNLDIIFQCDGSSPFKYCVKIKPIVYNFTLDDKDNEICDTYRQTNKCEIQVNRYIGEPGSYQLTIVISNSIGRYVNVTQFTVKNANHHLLKISNEKFVPVVPTSISTTTASANNLLSSSLTATVVSYALGLICLILASIIVIVTFFLIRVLRKTDSDKLQISFKSLQIN